MSVSPLERGEPVVAAAAAGHAALLAGAAGRTRFRPFLWVLTAFWVYVLISNLLYANNMQAGLTSMKIEGVFAPSGARLVQHLLLYPLFILCMWRVWRTGWQPLARTLPLQLACAIIFCVLARPALLLGEELTKDFYPQVAKEHEHLSAGESSWWDMFQSSELPTWIASASNFFVTYCFGVALVTGFAFYQRLRDAQQRSAALERALTQSHLAALRMQLSPHTLFNLLHTIRGQITWDPPAAQTMVVQLGDLLRRLLNAGEREFSRLSDEMQFVTLYLELQQRRFADRLSIELPARDALPRLWVPSLILQPLVENAVVHGLAGHEGPVRIQVDYACAADELRLRVLNTLGAVRAPSPDGIGLANVRERLEVQFGTVAHFSVGPEGGVWVAEIRMPQLRDGPEATPLP